MTAKEFNRCLDALPNDRNALEKIYNEYYLQLVYTALSMTKNREAAYDIASTVMLKLAGYRRTEWINSPAGFLIRMVHNVTKDYFRKENRCMEALPEEIAAASDLNSQLFYEDAMDSFTAEEKLIVTERLWGYKLKEISISVIKWLKKNSLILHYLNIAMVRVMLIHAPTPRARRRSGITTAPIPI